jgi:hypothetical protein
MGVSCRSMNSSISEVFTMSGRSFLRAQLQVGASATASNNISEINIPTGSTEQHASRSSETQSTDSSIEDIPMGFSSLEPDAGYPRIQIQHPGLHAELFDHHIDGGTKFRDAVITRSSVSTDSIDSFLSASTLYSSADSRWVRIPDNPEREYEFYAALLDIIDSILKHFGRTSHRRIENCSGTYFKHEDGVDSEAQLSRAPDIVIEGCGKHFMGNCFPARPGYPQCAALINVRTESNLQFWTNLIQIAVCVRYVSFIIFYRCSLRLNISPSANVSFSSTTDDTYDRPF